MNTYLTIEPKYNNYGISSQQRGNPFWIVAVVVETILLIVLFILYITKSPSTENLSIEYPDENPETMGELSEAKDLSVENPAIFFSAFASTLPTEESDTYYDALKSLSEKYTEKYSGEALAARGGDFKLDGKFTTSTTYPYGDLNVLRVFDDDFCAKFEFNSDFTLLSGYEKSEAEACYEL